MKKKSNHKTKPILGYTDKTTVKLDFDGELFRKVKYWSDRVMKHFRLGGYVILRSSRDHYHVVFDKTVSWEQNIRVMAWVALLSRNAGLRKWTLMQCIKEGSTLRISSKQEKASPRVVASAGNENQEIATFKRWRNRIKKADKQRFSQITNTD